MLRFFPTGGLNVYPGKNDSANGHALWLRITCIYSDPARSPDCFCQKPGKVATYYNAEKNATNVVLGFSDVSGESPCGLYISANASHPGKTAASPNSVNLVILRITPEEKIKSAPLRDLTLIADGQVMNLGLMETGSQQTNMDLRFETLQISMPYESFLKIANAKRVEGKLGPAKFTLAENNLNFIREFVGRMKS